MDHYDHQLLSAYADGEAGIATRLLIEAHLEQMPPRAAEFEKIRSSLKIGEQL